MVAKTIRVRIAQVERRECAAFQRNVRAESPGAVRRCIGSRPQFWRCYGGVALSFAASSAREATPSLRKMLATWFATVRGDVLRASAIEALS
jgi:hypothetical protein